MQKTVRNMTDFPFHAFYYHS